MNLMETAVTAGLLIVNTVTDLRKREILLLPTLLVLAGGLIRNCMTAAVHMTALLPGIAVLLFSAATSGKVGFGDGLAVCAAGVWCGTDSILYILFFALLSVPAYAGLRRVLKRPVRELPFMPFLMLGFCAERIIFWNAVR